MGNKGGVMIDFTLYGKRLVFINCHLASGISNVYKRNGDMKKVLKKFFEKKNPTFLERLLKIEDDQDSTSSNKVVPEN